MKGSNLASLISITLGIIVLIHHLIYTSRLFDVEDIWHHEFFAGVFIAFGMGVSSSERRVSNRLFEGCPVPSNLKL